MNAPDAARLPSFPEADDDDGALRARLVAAFVHPVKACAPHAVPALWMDALGGAEDDRRWVVLDADGAATWMGAVPALAKVHPELVGDALCLRAEGHADLRVPAGAHAGTAADVRVWDESIAAHRVHAGRDAGDDAAAWLAAVTGQPLRLARLPDASIAITRPNALHLLSRESCDEVAAALGREAAPGRYRPNLLIEGEDEPLPPFVEDHLAAVSWHDGQRWRTLRATGPCVRCVVPDVDPATGERGEGVLDTLARLSAARHPGAPVRFGTYLRGDPADAGARLPVGAPLRLHLAW